MTLLAGSLALATEPAVRVLLPALASAIAASFLARRASALGLVDHGGGVGLHRDGASEGVQLVGGLALAVGLVLATLLDPRSLQPRLWLALVSALAVGLADDRAHHGLRARAKLFLQCFPAACFALALFTPPNAWSLCAFGLALAAQNLANTFDHADGVLLATACVALAPARPAWSACCLAVLAFNLRRRARASVLLGDGGSHLIALMLACEPRAWGAFALPALDLARVALVRRRQGRAPWIGDRAHLAHRLQARGLRPPAVVAAVLAAALPAILAFAFFDSWLARCAGIAATALAFLLAVAATPDVDGRGVPLRASRCGSRPAAADRAP